MVYTNVLTLQHKLIGYKKQLAIYAVCTKLMHVDLEAFDMYITLSGCSKALSCGHGILCNMFTTLHDNSISHIYLVILNS